MPAEFRLQARYDPIRYPHLHNWWSRLPKGEGSRLLCELLDTILAENLDQKVFRDPPDPEEILDTIEYSIDQSMERVAANMFNGFLEALDGYMQRMSGKDFRGEWEREQQVEQIEAPMESVAGLLGGVEEW